MYIASATLELDTESLDPSNLSMPALIRELNQQKRPNWFLRKLMNTLESKRQAKGLGWSRPWNKFGLNIFSTHTFNTNNDPEYFELIRATLHHFLANAPEPVKEFADNLLSDPECMAFTFYHNSDIDGEQCEGLTLSLGRKVQADRSKRDRIDLILEDARIDGKVDRLVDRVRIYVCPWDNYKNDKQHYSQIISPFAPGDQRLTQGLYTHCVSQYHQWKKDESREWNHWSSRYIDYFGPRSFIPTGTSFS